jgi:hypothetical protein
MAAIRALQAAGWTAAVCIGLLLLGSSCGRKLLPIQPGALPPPTVVDLSYERHGSELLLLWTLPGSTSGKELRPAGFKVLRARQASAEANCRTCSMPFQVIADLSASGRSPGSPMRFKDRLEPGWKHHYKLQAYTADGVAGKDSNPVVVDD